MSIHDLQDTVSAETQSTPRRLCGKFCGTRRGRAAEFRRKVHGALVRRGSRRRAAGLRGAGLRAMPRPMAAEPDEADGEAHVTARAELVHRLFGVGARRVDFLGGEITPLALGCAGLVEASRDHVGIVALTRLLAAFGEVLGRELTGLLRLRGLVGRFGTRLVRLGVTLHLLRVALLRLDRIGWPRVFTSSLCAGRVGGLSV